ncbi:3'-5' exonuclease [Vibrio gazogenes]|uniref:DNA-directed DNA polymerase n=1 Tax=Vibrio gazogenes TaxID=687 RepID=A0A1Z2SB26_VIBGA|nr:3'-5' exonuclease [Vibrio gazogenes]ASA54369.1 DNA polymerase III subunit epsilon [Vibrio gazogenes]
MLKKLLKAPSIDWQKKYQLKQKRVTHPSLNYFYQQLLPDADTPIEEIEFLALDFETTGLNPAKDEIVTIGAVPFTLDRIQLSQCKHWLVKPRRPLKESSIIVHGITHTDIMDAPDLNEFLDDILHLMAGKIIVVHYYPIERQFLDQALKKRIKEGIEFPVVDTMNIEERILAQQSGGILNLMNSFKKKPSVRLGNTRERYGLPLYPLHDALLDALATAELLQAQIAHHYDRARPVSDFWI